MGKFIICFLAIFFINLACILDGNAGTISANDCSLSSVQAAISSASNGDRVMVPACTATWASVLTISKPITLQGAGIDQTTITLSQNCSSTSYNGAIAITAHASLNTRITGFTFNDSGGCSIWVNGSPSNTSKVRLDNLKSGTAHNNFVRWNGNQPGLIDHCTLPGTNSAEIISIFGNSETDWTTADNMGSENLLYIEDNDFNCTDRSACLVTSGFDGARFVVRRNTIRECSVDAHGNESGHTYGTRQVEIYNNTWSSQTTDKAIGMRGGTGVIFNNTAPAGTWGIGLLIYEICRGFGQGGCCCSYPCPQQPGRGQNYTLDPWYLWSNTNLDEFTDCGGLYNCDSCSGGRQDPADYVVLNRDYYLSAKPGYTPYIYPHPLTVIIQPPGNLRIQQ